MCLLEKRLLDALQHCRGLREEIVLGNDPTIELSILAIEPVAPQYRYIPPGDIAAADLDHDRRALLDPAAALVSGLCTPPIEQRADRLAEHVLSVQRADQRRAIIENGGILLRVAQHRHHDDL